MIATLLAGTVTLMTYNIHSGWGAEGQKWNLGEPIAAIKRAAPDVCTLNEVSWGGEAKGFNVDQPAIMGHILAPIWRTARGTAMKRADGSEYGNAILFAAKELSQETLPLPGREEKRILVAVEFPDYWVATTHLSLNEEERLKSVPIIAGWAAKKTKPVLLTGDWNAEPDTATIAEMKKHFTILSDTNVKTFSTMRPHATIDYIAVDTAHANKVRVVSQSVPDERTGSDHFPIVMKLDVAP